MIVFGMNLPVMELLLVIHVLTIILLFWIVKKV